MIKNLTISMLNHNLQQNKRKNKLSSKIRTIFKSSSPKKYTIIPNSFLKNQLKNKTLGFPNNNFLHQSTNISLNTILIKYWPYQDPIYSMGVTSKILWLTWNWTNFNSPLNLCKPFITSILKDSCKFKWHLMTKILKKSKQELKNF